jgi:hypothetical protein
MQEKIFHWNKKMRTCTSKNAILSFIHGSAINAKQKQSVFYTFLVEKNGRIIHQVLKSICIETNRRGSDTNK